MPGRPAKGHTYPKGKLNQMASSYLLGQAFGPGEMSITPGEDISGPVPEGAAPLGQTDPSFNDLRKGWWEKKFQQNTAESAKQSYVLAKAADARQFGYNKALQDLAQTGNVNLETLRQVGAKNLAETNAQNAIEQLKLKAGFDTQAAINKASQDRVTAVQNFGLTEKSEDEKAKRTSKEAYDTTARAGVAKAGGIATGPDVLASFAQALNPLALRSATASRGVEADTLESEEGRAASKENILAVLAKAGIDNRAARFMPLAPGSAITELTDEGIQPRVSNPQTTQEFENVWNPTSGKNERSMTRQSSVGRAVRDGFIPAKKKEKPEGETEPRQPVEAAVSAKPRKELSDKEYMEKILASQLLKKIQAAKLTSDNPFEELLKAAAVKAKAKKDSYAPLFSR